MVSVEINLADMCSLAGRERRQKAAQEAPEERENQQEI